MILAINTSTVPFGLALIKDHGTVHGEYLIHPSGKNFVTLMPALDSLLRLSGFHLPDIRGIIAAQGPGSFTGLRIGLSMVKGLGQSLQIPIIGVSSLEALAYQLPFVTSPICALIESRKSDVFAAFFQWSHDGCLIRHGEDMCLPFEEISHRIRGETVFIGNNFENQGALIQQALGEGALLAPAYLWGLRASSVGIGGLKRFQSQDFDDLFDFMPSYLRPPDIRPDPPTLLKDRATS